MTTTIQSGKIYKKYLFKIAIISRYKYYLDQHVRPIYKVWISWYLYHLDEIQYMNEYPVS